MTMELHTRRRAIVLALAAAIGLAACSSATSSNNGTKSHASLDAAGAACVASAKATVDTWTAEKPFTGPSETIDMKRNSGKTFYLLLTVVNQFSGEIADGFKAAAKAAGANAVIYDGKGTVTEWNAGMNQAVAQNAAGIVLWGIPPALVQQGVVAAKAKGIPVIDSVNGSVTDPLQPGIAAHVDVNSKDLGQAIASTFLYKSGCKANVGMIWPHVLPELNAIGSATEASMKQMCPSCKVVTAQMDLSTLATSLPEQVRTMFTANPDLNYFTPIFDSAVTFAAPVISQFKGVQITGHDGISTSLAMVRSGGPQTVDITYPPNPYLGWSLFSILGGLAVGQPADPALLRIPERMVTTSTIPPTNAGIWPAYANYQNAFLKAWGLS